MGVADRELLARLRDVFAGHPDVRLALLFGSRARGDARVASDVDLAVAAPGADPLSLAAEVGHATGLTVDVVDLDRAGYFLLKALLREGVVVHEGEAHASAGWRTRAMLTVATDGPNFERMRDAFLRRTAAARGG